MAGHVLQLFAYTRKLFLGLQRAAIRFQQVVAVLLDGCAHLGSCLDDCHLLLPCKAVAIGYLLLTIFQAPPAVAGSCKRTRALVLLQSMPHTCVPLILLVALKDDLAIRCAVLDVPRREMSETRLSWNGALLHSPVPFVTSRHRREWWKLR